MIPHVAGRWARRKPRWRPALDRRHPLTRGLGFYAPLLDAGQAIDLAASERGLAADVVGSGASWTDGPWGRSVKGDGVNPGLNWTGHTGIAPTADGVGTGAFSMAVISLAISSGTRRALFVGGGTAATSRRYGFFANQSPTSFTTAVTGNFTFLTGTGAQANTSGIALASGADGQWHLWVGVRDASGNLYLYRDGVLVASDTTPPTLRDIYLASDGYDLAINHYDDTALPNDGDVALAAGWTRALAADEVARFTNAPFGLLAPMSRRIAVAVVSGATFEQALAGGAGAATAMARGIAKPLAAQAGTTAAIQRWIGKALVAAAGALAGLATLLGGQATKPVRASVATVPAVAAVSADTRVARATDSDASATFALAVDAGAA